jgi:hydrogenase maturation protease
MMRTLVAGVGSCNGDDRVAWTLLEQLAVALPAVKMVPLADPTKLIDHLDGWERLLVVDATRTGGAPAGVLRFAWPDPMIENRPGRSSHGIGLGAVLAIAERLGRLPPQVVVFGIEGEVWDASADLSPAVAAALPGLRDRLLQELSACAQSAATARR